MKKDKSGKNNNFYGKHHSEETKKKLSEYCKRIGRIPPLRTGSKMSESAKIKISEAGKKRWDIIGRKDKSQLKRKDERNDSLYHWWVGKIKKRDKNICLFNNNDCSGYCIVHHILPWRDFPELRYEIKNGITLCQHHHPRKRVDETRLIPFFQIMVESKEII